MIFLSWWRSSAIKTNFTDNSLIWKLEEKDVLNNFDFEFETMDIFKLTCESIESSELRHLDLFAYWKTLYRKKWNILRRLRYKF